MKCMIVLFALSAVAVTSGQHWGGHHGAPAPVQETPEVAAARAAHFAAVAQAQGPAQHGAPAWNGAPAHNAWNAPSAAQQPRYQGPVALPPGYDANGAPLPVQDTPEVAAEKASQLNLLSRAGGHVPAASWNAAPAHNAWNAAPAHNAWNGAPAQAWNAAPAPAWNAGHGAGHPVDTPEVAAAKAAHLAAHAAAGTGAHHGQRWRRSAVLALPYTSYPGSTAPLVHALPAPIVHAPLIRSYPVVPSAYGHWL